MKTATYRCLQSMAAALCTASSVTFAENASAPRAITMAEALFAVGWGDWCVTVMVSLSFGLVSLLQRFKRSEAGTGYRLFIAAHMSGSLISGVVAYLLTQGYWESPNRFAQALAIGLAGWGGSTVADLVAAKLNRTLVEKTP
jgi:hypothetical protein